jgi:hypothetical protein
LRAIVEDFNNTHDIAISMTVKSRKSAAKSGKSQAHRKCMIILMLM